jgi:DNA-binding CsgD family transcriptional regulator
MVGVMRPRTLLQLALAVVAMLAAIANGWSVLRPTGWAIGLACGAGLVWVVRALVFDRVPVSVDIVLLGLMLVASTVAAGPTTGVALEPAAGSMVIVLGSASMPRWTLWAWPVAGGLLAGTSLLSQPPHSPQVITIVAVLGVAVLGGYVRRRSQRESAGRLERLERAHCDEIGRLRATVERALTPRRLQEQFPNLSSREAEVLALIAQGMSNQEIAEALFISVSTVKTHVNALFGKMPARDRGQAIALALGTRPPTPVAPAVVSPGHGYESLPATT